MTRKKITLAAALSLAAMTVFITGGCKKHDHGHAGHDHAEHSAHVSHDQPQFANTTCPIMGSRIVPERVTAALTREYKGQKIAFCCPGCPEKWDALSEQEKQAKLN